LVLVYISIFNVQAFQVSIFANDTLKFPNYQFLLPVFYEFYSPGKEDTLIKNS
jgi:hypothetical protein